MDKNEFIIEGKIIQDSELIGQKNNVVQFSVNNIQRKKNAATGNWEDTDNVLTFSVWGGAAEDEVYALQRKCHAGAEVIIFGQLVNDDYQTAQGKLVTRTKLQVWKDGIVFKATDDEQSEDDEPDDWTKEEQFKAQSQKTTSDPAGPEMFDDDIPF